MNGTPASSHSAPTPASPSASATAKRRSHCRRSLSPSPPRLRLHHHPLRPRPRTRRHRLAATRRRRVRGPTLLVHAVRERRRWRRVDVLDREPARWANFSTATGRLSGTPRPPMSAPTPASSSASAMAKRRSHCRRSTSPSLPARRGSATLSWTPPTQNSDGSALTNLSGYSIYWGRAPQTLHEVGHGE